MTRRAAEDAAGRQTSTSRCHSGGSRGRGLTHKTGSSGEFKDCKDVLSTFDDMRWQGWGPLSLQYAV